MEEFYSYMYYTILYSLIHMCISGHPKENGKYEGYWVLAAVTNAMGAVTRALRFYNNVIMNEQSY